MIGLVDLTDLSDDCTSEAIDRLCRRAIGPHGAVAAVCVWPRFVAQAASRLRSTGVDVATVVNFPSGDEPVDVVVAATRQALTNGADEIDLVIPYRALLAGDDAVVDDMLGRVRAVVTAPARLKVIVESGELGDSEIVRSAARRAIDAGADFVKTSTGKTPVSATPAAMAALLAAIVEARAVGRTVGVKPSGGIRTAADAEMYLSLAEQALGDEWPTSSTFRFGASALLDDLEAIAATDAAARPSGGQG